LFEYEVSSGFDCTEQEQKAIAKLEKILGDRLFDLTIHNGKLELKARQYVGVFRLGDRTVEVLPKMYRSNDATSQKQEAVRNLLYMLEYTHQLSVIPNHKREVTSFLTFISILKPFLTPLNFCPVLSGSA
jgi:5-methylcytosine-specific restriction enzyme subunit McrC